LGNTLVQPGNRTTLKNFILKGTSSSTYQFPIGLEADGGAVSASDVLIDSMYVSADTDIIYIDVSGCNRWNITNSQFESKWDCLAVPSDFTCLIDKCRITAAGPSAYQASISTTACVIGAGDVVVTNSILKASGSAVHNYAASASAGTYLRLRDCVLQASGTLPYDMISFSTGTIIDNGGNSGSSTGGSLLTSGTITTRQYGGLDAVIVETGVNARQALSAIAAAGTGDCSVVDNGDGTFTFTYKGVAVSTVRVTADCSSTSKSRNVTLSLPS
jgi:hypothetical protein